MKKLKLLSIALFLALLAGSASAQAQPQPCDPVCYVPIDNGTFSFASLQDHFPDALTSYDGALANINTVKMYKTVTSQQIDNYTNYLSISREFSNLDKVGHQWVKDSVLDKYYNINAKVFIANHGSDKGLELHLAGNVSVGLYPASDIDIAFRDVYGSVSGEGYWTEIRQSYTENMSTVFGTLEDSNSNTHINTLRSSDFTCDKYTGGVVWCEKSVDNIRYGWIYKNDHECRFWVQNTSK
jgi:hypothetical protein